MIGIKLRVAVAVAVCGCSVFGETNAVSRQIKARVLQPPYGRGWANLEKSVRWQMDRLDECDASLDLIVLPEASDRQAILSREENARAWRQFNAPILEKCAATAKRCDAVVCVNAYRETESGVRNTTYVYDRTGTCVWHYDKHHLTPGERDPKRAGLDHSYADRWIEPAILDLDGIRYAFLTCYDFYFYEAYSNIARHRPDIIIGCSHQRSDPHPVLETINRFCAYNIGAYLVRASVSMGEESSVGGCSTIVAPSGEVLGDMKSRVGELTVTFDPKKKYLKPAGFGNPPDVHPAYVEKGRRPWQYRPAGSAIIPPFNEAPAKRLCAHRGFSAVAPENSLPAYGAAVALGASEIEFDLWWTKDGEIVSVHDITLDRVSDGTGKVTDQTYPELLKYDFGMKKGAHFKGMKIVRFEDILAKFACQVLMNIHIKPNNLTEDQAKGLLRLIDAYDARRHVYFMTASERNHKLIERLAPDIPRCMGYGSVDNPDIVERAIRCRCGMVQLFKPHFDQAMIDRAHAAGIRCNVFFADDPAEARRYLDMGVDTILTNDYQPIATATGLK